MATEKDKSLENTEYKEIFVNDSNAESMFVTQKCKRIAGAVYAVTQFFALDEPLRKRLRENALKLVGETTNPKGGSLTKTISVLDEVYEQLRIAYDGGLISSMNYRVLREEITGLKSRLSGGNVSIGPRLNQQYIDVSEDALEASLPAGGGRNKSTTGSSSKTQADADASPGSSTTESDKTRSAKARRRQRILDLFADTDEITINDVTEVITGFSKKTLQRDLKALVKAGKLEKHGKRRWSSYTKAESR